LQKGRSRKEPLNDSEKKGTGRLRRSLRNIKWKRSCQGRKKGTRSGGREEVPWSTGEGGRAFLKKEKVRLSDLKGGKRCHRLYFRGIRGKESCPGGKTATTPLPERGASMAHDLGPIAHTVQRPGKKKRSETSCAKGNLRPSGEKKLCNARGEKREGRRVSGEPKGGEMLLSEKKGGEERL